jgi:HNH endonuclease/NUMOD3 motif
MTKSRGLRVRRGTRAKWVTEQQGLHFCGCGCGEPIQIQPVHFNIGIPAYLLGHNSRVANPNPKREPVPQEPCACGCGELAAPRKRYITGHSSRGRRLSADARRRLSESKRGERNPMFGKTPPNAKPKPKPVPCGCGCGQDAGPGRRYISGHNTRGETADLARAYQKGWYKRVDGYVFILSPDHPLASHGYVPEHRLVVERFLRATQPDSPYLLRLGNQLYLRPEFIVHHEDEVKDNNVIENLRPMTKNEHKRWHNEHPRK